MIRATTPAARIYQDVARKLKRDRILAALDESVGSDPADAEPTALFLESMDDEDWAALAGAARVHLPSVVVRSMVIDAVKARAQRVAS